MTDAIVLVLRLWLGLVMLAHGYNHARSIEGTTKWFTSQGFRRPRMVAVASAVGEIAVGAGLVVGLLTSIAAAGLVAVTVTAFWTVHRYAGFFVFRRPDEGWEYVGTLAVAAAVLAVMGPGSYSTDAALGWAERLDGPVGLAAVAGGVAAAALLLAVGWRSPEE